MNQIAIEVAIVGAGPYGLSVAAHLRNAGVDYRQLGRVMHPWRTSMPGGMFLKSQGFASNLSDPGGTHTLAAFCSLTGRAYADYGWPVPLDTFVAYGQWFAAECAPGLDEVHVTSLRPHHGGFELVLDGGERVRARNVVVATGIEHYAHIPRQLSVLPGGLCTHSSAHAELSGFAGRRVAVIGAGQSALESAALLHEKGADVTLVAREPELTWNGPPLPPGRSLLQWLREPEAGLGSGWATWFYSRHPGLFWHLPRATRIYRARTALGPAGACWLHPRVEGQFPILTGYQVQWARPENGHVRVSLTSRSGPGRELTADHIIAATGYRPDLGRLSFLDDSLRARLRTAARTPAVGANYQSSIPGLYFTGPVVAPAFGPVMRFVYGTGHAAHTIARRITAAERPEPRVTAGAPQ